MTEGWNLVGYSGTEDIAHSSINRPATVQKQFVTLDTTTQKYEMAPYHSTNLEAGKAYWVYATEDTNMTIPNAKSTAVEEESISIADLRFTNGTAVKTLGEAVSAGWIEGTTGDAVRWYNGSADEGYRWIDVPLSCPPLQTCQKTSVISWDGVFIKGAINGLEVLR